MAKLKISKGFRKFLRKKKAEIRRQILDIAEQEKMIKQLYENIAKNFPSEIKNSK